MSGLALLGLVFVAFVAWHFMPQSKPPGPSPKFRREGKATADNPQWRGFFEQHCESPAETAFLRAMIETHDLRPEDGSLWTEGLKIDLQVQEGGYHVDFLANEWLVVEIDGAAYHSSEKAKARDRQRDDYFEGLGYSVLRIPAKVVFTDPDEAVRRVGLALNVGKRKIAAPVQTNGFSRLGKTMPGLSRALDEINGNVSRMRKMNGALSCSRRAFSIERSVIGTAIESAMRQLRTEDYIGQSKIGAAIMSVSAGSLMKHSSVLMRRTALLLVVDLSPSSKFLRSHPRLLLGKQLSMPQSTRPTPKWQKSERPIWKKRGGRYEMIPDWGRWSEACWPKWDVRKFG